MSTSLAEQLRRLATPQTALLQDSKKRASILFDQKEAATKDRETIYDIGKSGLDELILLNPSFVQFEHTFFSRTAKSFQRSVESSDVNKILDKNIKKFLFHLSPYFLLQPAHKCLEWMIRRFNIHEFNKNDFLALILPYHSTKMFVKCVQIMRIKNPQDPWNWLDVIKKPGIPLSKQVLFNRAANDKFLLKFICKSMLSAVKELDAKAYTLQTMFAFYTTTVLGALDVAPEVTDSHISNIFGTVIKGFSSNITDFCASSLMITGYLITKTKLSAKFLDAVNAKLVRITHPALQNDAVILLILIFKTQSDSIKTISNETLSTIVGSRNFSTILGKINEEGIDILPFYLPLLSACLRNVQIKSELWTSCREFCGNLLLEVVFKRNEADSVIRCILDSYIIREKTESDIITIESDNEDIEMTEDNVDVNTWYSEMLKMMERQYPEIFDQVTKSIMLEKSDKKSNKNKSLKTVLGFLFTTACSDDGLNIFENLYHYNAKNRINAVRYLVQNFEKMSFSDDSKDLLRDSISERLNDDSPLVVNEILKFKTTHLIRAVGHQILIDKLKPVIMKIYKIRQDIWNQSAYLAIGHLTSKEIVGNIDQTEVFLDLCPFFYLSTLPMEHVYLILGSEFAKNNPFWKGLDSYSHDSDNLSNCFMAKLKKGNDLPQVDDVLRIVDKLSNKKLDIQVAYTSILLLTYSPHLKQCDVATLKRILEFVGKCLALFQKKSTTHEHFIEKGLFPISAAINCIEKLYKSIDLTLISTSGELYFGCSNETFDLIRRVYEIYLMGLFQKEFNTVYNDAMNQLLNFAFPKIENRVEFSANYFISQEYFNDDEKFDESIQIRSIRVMNLMLNQIKDKTKIAVNLSSLIRILNGLSSKLSPIRALTYETLEIISTISSINPTYLTFIQKLLIRKEELLLDEDQLALISFRIFTASKSPKDATFIVLNELIEFIADLSQPIILVALILDMLKHVNCTQILRKIAPTALSMVKQYENEDRSKPINLSIWNSHIIKSILYRFTQETISAIKEYPECWLVVIESMKLFNLTVREDDGKSKSIATITMDSFEPGLFEQLPTNKKIEFLDYVVQAATFSENPDVCSVAGKFIKKIEINGNECLAPLQRMKDIRVDCDMAAGRKKSKNGSTSMSIATLNTKEWKCGVTWLEYLQNKKRLTNAHVLIPYFFDILKKCIDFENESAAEYAKQLILSAILHCCQIISPNGVANRTLLPDKVFKIDLIVQCIRGTQNPQTHHHALQLLSHTAAMIPEQVLMNMMEIFTFMGSTVVRRDDAYTYQIISNIIKSIIPTLIKANERKSRADQDALVIPVLKVFSGIILDVPEHRRVRLYTDLLTTLDTRQYLWMFLIVLFESLVFNFEKNDKKSDEEKRIFIAVDLVNKFDASIAIESCSKLIEFLHKQPFVIQRNKEEKIDIDITDTDIFNVDNYTDKQLRHFRYSTLQFISLLVKPSSELASKIALLSDEEALTLKSYFKDIIVKALQFLVKVIKTAEQQNTKYWKFILHYSYDILEQVMALLTPYMLLQVVGGLLNNIPEVRRKAIELLNKKLQQPDFFANCDKVNFLPLLEPLTTIIESITDETKLCANATSSESVALQQHALIGIKLLSINLASDYAQEFTPILVILSTSIKKNADIPTNVLGQLVLCLAEVCANLRAHSISHLSKFMPALGKLLQKQVITITPALSPILVAIYKIIETLPLFLSPYMINIILSLSKIWSKITTSTDPKKLSVISKLEAIWMKVSTVLSIRVLIPIIDQGYSNLIDDREYCAIGPLMKLLLDSFSKLSSHDIAIYQNDLTVFFIKALQLRSTVDLNSSIVDAPETHSIQAFVGLVLKLSESSFRPLYCKILEWAIKEDTSIKSAITFYRLSSKVAESLKSLFILFANDFIQNAADFLIKYTNFENDENAADESKLEIILLIENIIQTLSNVFLYDSQGFINNHRFDILMQPIVDQLENELVLSNEHAKEKIPICLAQLAKAVNDDTMWKQLNYQILLKTRNNNADIRLFALKACVEVAKILGDDFLPLLPETVPFLAELMEDESPIIEKQCQKSIQELEHVLGESLQKYF